MTGHRLYRFPSNGRANELALGEQTYCVIGEAHEVLDAWHMDEGEERIIEELWDTIHAAEGALRKFDPRKVREGYWLVLGKNNQRGDYSAEATDSDDWGMA